MFGVHAFSKDDYLLSLGGNESAHVVFEGVGPGVELFLLEEVGKGHGLGKIAEPLFAESWFSKNEFELFVLQFYPEVVLFFSFEGSHLQDLSDIHYSLRRAVVLIAEKTNLVHPQL